MPKHPIDQIIQARKTEKVLANVQAPLAVSDTLDITSLLMAASWAPFHKPAHESHRINRQDDLKALMPWRCYHLKAQSCRSLLERLKTWSKDDPSWMNGKIPSMLASADALLIVTFLPNPSSKPLEAPQLFEASKDNMEHIAAASAAIQNLLLAATARGIANYWSSGGNTLLRSEIYQLLEIPSQEILLGAIFLFPQQVQNDAVTIEGGSWRNERGELGDWSKGINLS
ncbi:MAG: nitroreductase family protein [Deinococcales bacterium]